MQTRSLPRSLFCIAAVLLIAACEDPAPSITWEELCEADPTLESCSSPRAAVHIVDVPSDFRLRDPTILVGADYVERTATAIRTPSTENTCRMSFVLDLMDDESEAACQQACDAGEGYACDILSEIQ